MANEPVSDPAPHDDDSVPAETPRARSTLLGPPFQYLGGLGAITQAALDSLFPDYEGHRLFSELPFGERCLLAQAGIQAVQAGLLVEARAQSLQERAFGPSTSEISDMAQALQQQLDTERARVGSCLQVIAGLLPELPEATRAHVRGWLQTHPRFVDLESSVQESVTEGPHNA